MLTYEELKRLLYYDPETGRFTNLTQRGPRCPIGATAGTIDGHGYAKLTVQGKNYAGHRLAWLYMTENWPEQDIDHENRIRSDNAWANLRLATKSENGQNQNLSSVNKSGYTGVSWNKEMNKWQSQIGINKKQHLLGYFVCPKEASLAYKTAKLSLHTFNPVLL